MALIRVFLLVFLALTGAASARPPTIAAASDLQFVLPEILDAFARSGGGEIRPVYGSSGNLYRQIGQGAPFELFFSADEAYVLRLSAKGRVEDAGQVYARGRLALALAPGAEKPDAEGLRALALGLAEGKIRKIAIANPDHAPYGRAAREALQGFGLWDRIERHLVLGESVTQAAQFVATGGAEAGLIALSVAPPLAARAKIRVLPETLHGPLIQRMAVVVGAGPTARAFYAFMQGPEAKTALRRAGFEIDS